MASDANTRIVFTEEMVDAGMDVFMDFEIAESSPHEMLKNAFIAMLSVYLSNLERGSINRGPHQQSDPKTLGSIPAFLE